MMRKLTEADWEILGSFRGPEIDRERIFDVLQLRANFEEMKDLLVSIKDKDDAVNKFGVLISKFPDSMSYWEREEIYRLFLLQNWHHDHENMIAAFQRYFNRSPDNIAVILKRMEDLPMFYRYDEALRDPFIRKCLYAIAAQPEPESINALTILSQSDDESIRGYAHHQLEKIATKKGQQ